jgi:phage baseplate assembly protein W
MRPIGIQIPIQLGGQGYFEQTFTTLDAAKSNLINLLLTNKGERYMQPELGTDIYKLLFQNIEADLETQIEERIRQQTSFWLPYVLIQGIGIDVSPENMDLSKINISITFSVKADPDRFDTINLEFQF